MSTVCTVGKSGCVLLMLSSCLTLRHVGNNAPKLFAWRLILVKAKMPVQGSLAELWRETGERYRPWSGARK